MNTPHYGNNGGGDEEATTIGPKSRMNLATVVVVCGLLITANGMLVNVNARLNRLQEHVISDWVLVHQIMWADRLRMANGTNLIVPDPEAIARSVQHTPGTIN